jgi:branched-chain amino acid transport system permease protein
MQLIVELLLFGLTLGGLYAMVAMGLTLQYGVARIMHLAYGEWLVAAAFGAYAAFTYLHLSPLVTLALSLPVGFGVNWIVYQVLLSPLVRRTNAGPALEIDSLLATFGLLFVVQGVMQRLTPEGQEGGETMETAGGTTAPHACPKPTYLVATAGVELY